jgi:hypothetical protein
VFSDDVNDRDSHGMFAIKYDRYLWVTDRTGNLIEVFDPESGEWVNTIPLSQPEVPDPSPDLLDIAPAGNRIYVSLRGPIPLTGDPHASTGSTPGLGVIRVTQGGRHGVLQAAFQISNVDALGIERADPHAVRVRVH